MCSGVGVSAVVGVSVGVRVAVTEAVAAGAGGAGVVAVNSPQPESSKAKASSIKARMDICEYFKRTSVSLEETIQLAALFLFYSALKVKFEYTG